METKKKAGLIRFSIRVGALLVGMTLRYGCQIIYSQTRYFLNDHLTSEKPVYNLLVIEMV